MKPLTALHYSILSIYEQILVDCYPFNYIMTAMGVSHIDYLALDIEGAETDVLQTIDFTRFRIDILTIEYHQHNENGAFELKLAKIMELFKKLKVYQQVPTDGEYMFARVDL